MTHVSPRVHLSLHARSFAIDGRGDLLDRLGPNGFAWLDGDGGFVTSGVAATIPIDDAPTALRAIAHERADDAPATAGPRAVGALPFAGEGVLTVPSALIARDEDGRMWCTLVETDDMPAPLHVVGPRPRRYAVEALTTEDGWHDAVRRVLAAIDDGAVEKAVLARAVDIDADVPIDRRSVLAYLRRTQPGCIVYCDGAFVGASPELLVRVSGDRVVARPLAGTGVDVAQLVASRKDAHEHRVVVDAVVAALTTGCDDVVATGPAPLSFRDVVHLATTVEARRRAGVSALDLVRTLHPTPAVGGNPRAAALALIDALEPVERGRYAGPCGWVDARGNGEFVVALRGGSIDGSRVRVHAGAGIVAGSDPAAEWAETQQKLEPMLRAVIRP